MHRISLTALLLLAAPTLAHAGRPEIGVEVAVVSQDAPEAVLDGMEGRLLLRLDQDDALSSYARAGHGRYFELDGNPWSVAGAVGVDGRLPLGPLVELGLRVGVGLQYAEYGVGGVFVARHEIAMTSAFVEVVPLVAVGPAFLGFELRAHLPTEVDSQAPDLEENPGMHLALDVIAGVRF